MVVAGDISDERALEAPGTRLRVKPEPVGQRLPTSRVTRGWKPSRLALASDGGKWSGRWESNPRLKLGKLGYYHYTTPAARLILVGITGVGKSVPSAGTGPSSGRNLAAGRRMLGSIARRGACYEKFTQRSWLPDHH